MFRSGVNMWLIIEPFVLEVFLTLQLYLKPFVLFFHESNLITFIATHETILFSMSILKPFFFFPPPLQISRNIILGWVRKEHNFPEVKNKG